MRNLRTWPRVTGRMIQPGGPLVGDRRRGRF